MTRSVNSKEGKNNGIIENNDEQALDDFKKLISFPSIAKKKSLLLTSNFCLNIDRKNANDSKGFGDKSLTQTQSPQTNYEFLRNDQKHQRASFNLPMHPRFDLQKTKADNFKHEKFKLDLFDIGLNSGQNELTNYINASYISHPYLEGIEKSFIITQLPLSNTISQFWMMAQETGCKVIIMLCGYKEVNDQQRYYPTSDQILVFEKIEVSLVSKTKHQFYTQRVFNIEDLETKSSQQISHYKVSTWADKDGLTESNYNSFIDLTKSLVNNYSDALNLHTSNKSSMIIHCKAGIGRSGVFAAWYFLTEYLMFVENQVKINGFSTLNKYNPGISVFSTVRKLREFRWGLVQTSQQYFELYELCVLFIQKFILKVASV